MTDLIPGLPWLQFLTLAVREGLGDKVRWTTSQDEIHLAQINDMSFMNYIKDVSIGYFSAL